MKDEQKTREQLLNELVKMRQRVAELEALEAERKRAEEALRESEEQYRTLFADSQRQAQELALLNQVRMALASELDLPILFRTVVEAIADTFGYTLVSLYLLQDDVLVLQHQVGYDQVIEEIPITQGITGRVTRTGEPVLLEDVRTDATFLGAIEGIVSVVCVPLFDQGRVLGVLNVESSKGITLGEVDLRLMTALSEHISVAIGRARLYAEVQESEDRYIDLYDNAPDMYFTIRRDGTVLSVNRLGAEMLGYQKEELIGRPVAIVFHPEDVASVQRQIDEMLKSREGISKLEFRKIRKDGSVMYVSERVSPQYDPQGEPILRIICRDITERKQAEEEIRQRTAQLEALREVELELIAYLDLDTLLHSITSRAIELVGGMSGGLYLYRPERGVLEWSVTIGPNLAPIGTILHQGEGLSGKVWETGETIIVDDYRQWEGQAVIYEDYPWMAVVGVPVHWGEEFLGVLNVLADPPHTFSQADAELLSLFANQAATAVRNARLYEDARSRAERLAVVNHIARAASATLHLDDLLETVYYEIMSIFQSDAFFIALYDEEANELDFRLRVDEGMREPQERRPPGTGLTSLVVAEKKPLLIRDFEKEQDHLPSPGVWGTMRIPASWLGVPMMIGQQLIGVISVQAYRPHAYGEEEQQLLSTVADQVAVAIENARLFEEERRTATQLALINEVGEKAAAILDLDRLMQEVTRSIRESFDYYNVALGLLDEECHEIVVRAMAGGFEHTVPGEYRQSVDEGIIGFVARTGKSWLANDTSNDLYYIKGFLGEVLTKSELAVPIRLGDEVIGVLDLQSIDLNDFDQSDVVAMEAVADRLAIAIQNARLFTEADQRARELSTMLEAARAVSSTLNLEQVLALIAEEMVRATGAAGCTLSRWDREADAVVTLTEWRQRRMEMTDEPGTSYALGNFPTTRTVLEKRQPISILATDPDADPSEVALLQKNDSVSLLMLPLVVGEQVIGLVELDESDREREFTAAEIRLCQALADQAAMAIQNAKLFEETRQRALQLQTVEEVGRRVSAILDPGELFPYVARAIQQNFDYYHVDIFLVDQPTGYAVFKASSDPALEKAWEEQGLRFKIGEEGMIGWVAHTGRPLLANDISQEPLYLPDELLPQTKSELTVPLKVGERVVGVLDVDSEELNAFNEDDLFVLQTLANQIAIAIENARLYKAEQQRRRDAEALRETALALTSALDRNQVIERILSQLQQVVPYDSASVQLLQGDRLVIIGGRGFPNLKEILGISFPVDGDNPNREVIRTLSPFILEDAPAMYEEFRKGPHLRTVIRSWLGVPMLIGGRSVGMIALDKSEPGFYTQEHARLAQTFAAQAAIAIENARLFEEVEERRVYLEGVLGAAPDAIVTLDASHRIVEWNPGAQRLFGYSWEEAVGQNIDDLVTGPDVLQEAVGFTQIVMAGLDVPPVETVRCRRDGSPVHVIVAGSPIIMEDELIGVVAVYTDITQRKRMEEALRAMALIDDLTGLYNRRGFLTLGQQQLKTANRIKSNMLLLFADFDGLKGINDTFGHLEGDRALIEVAKIFQQTFRESDILGRIGGDEFVVLALETDEDSAEILSTRLQENLKARNAKADLHYKLSLSVGVARYDPEAPCSIDELVARADRLMYERKRHEQES